MESMYIIILGVASFISGAAIAYFLKIRGIRNKALKLLREAEAEAEVAKKEKIVQAKEKFLQLKMEHEKYIAEKNSKIASLENKQKQRENILNQRRDEIQKKFKEYEIKKKEIETIKQNLSYQVELIDKKNLELEKLHREQVEKLESVAGISAQEAKDLMMES
jgi:ribonuclease Y